MNKAFTNFQWENDPSVNTPLSAENLNKVNNAVNEIDNRVVGFDTTKANQSDMLTAITNVTFNETSGAFTFTRKNGTSFELDTKLEKVVTNFDFDVDTQTLYLNLQDGTRLPVDLSAFITNVEFENTATIRWEKEANGKMKAYIIGGSVTADMIEPNYLANVQLYAGQALSSSASAKDFSESAKQSADSAAASAIIAEEAAEKATEIAGGDFATNDRVDKIQTTSEATLSQAGWYRVAEYKATSEANLLGNLANSCKIALRRVSTSNSGTCRLSFESKYQSQEFKVESVNIKSNVFSKIRYVYDASVLKAYIEVYCTTSNVELHVTITDSASVIEWKAITPTLTEETVSGVTVTTTYDIPANASPVTDLDLVRHNIANESASTLDAFNALFENDANYSVTRKIVTVGFSDTVLTSSFPYYVETYNIRANRRLQLIYGYDGGDTRAYMRVYTGAWGAFRKISTDKDLANYLPLNGGEIAKASQDPFAIKNTNSASGVYTKYLNGDGTLGYFGFNSNGTPIVMPNTWQNSKELLHTGNVGSYALPIGGGTINGTGYTPLQIRDSNYDVTLISFQGKSGALGELGFDGSNNPTFRDTSANYRTLLHTGNKPSGTYTGNDTNRTIETGGSGNGYLISGSNGTMAIVAEGAICASGSTLKYISSGNVRVQTDGKIYLASRDETLNASGVTYTYQAI